MILKNYKIKYKCKLILKIKINKKKCNYLYYQDHLKNKTILFKN